MRSTLWGLRCLCVGLFAAGLAFPVASEVRIVGASGPAGLVRVSFAPHSLGPWTPKGPVDARVLNPTGDVVGDGMPALLEAETHVFAAWTRSSTGQLLIAQGNRDAWLAPVVVDAQGALGTPHLRPVADALVVTYQQLSADGVPTVGVQVTGSGGSVGYSLPDAGWLLSSWGGSAGGSILLLASDGELVVYSHIRPPFEPIEWERVALDITALPSLSRGLASSRLGLGIDEFEIPLVSLHESGPRVESRHFLALWLSPQAVAVFELESGSGQPLMPAVIEVDEKQRNYSPSLLNQALRELR